MWTEPPRGGMGIAPRRQGPRDLIASSASSPGRGAHEVNQQYFSIVNF